MNRALLILALCAGLAACDMKPWPPRADYGSCLKGHTESGLMLIPNSNGGLSYIPTSDYVCDEYEYPLGDGPEYQAGMKRYAAELQAWYERHPEERP
ncbi:hypothetical protein [Stenotrophomonas maltophilia]|uniref:hypothetical protein n=1 Tax=Stenotrophomonas maltophilia TaxID=40324 RepID=UPI000DA95690|nr:hypothetical protein [Stenotrophomonas maltophilia]PZS57411.1 hypothetical protein A7X58_10350 [Stenotrophomonas maltophilia]